MFADIDLRRFSQIVEIADYPLHLFAATKHLAEMKWMYTGALENYPGEIEQLRPHQLLGNRAQSLSRSRDPWWLQNSLREAGFSSLRLSEPQRFPVQEGNWVYKPLHSAGGRAIHRWTGQQLAEEGVGPCLLQEYVEGFPVSAAFLATSEWVEILGISTQLCGHKQLNAPEFGYCGSVVNQGQNVVSCLSADQVLEIERIGQVLGKKAELAGLFGVDFVISQDSVWTIEINPRYTASMELYDRALNCSLIDWHVRACEAKFRSAELRELQREVVESKTRAEQLPTEFFGKVVLYADRNSEAPDLSALIPRKIDRETWSELADIPCPGTIISRGMPVFTCFGSSRTEDSLVDSLIVRANFWWSQFP